MIAAPLLAELDRMTAAIRAKGYATAEADVVLRADGRVCSLSIRAGTDFQAFLRFSTDCQIAAAWAAIEKLPPSPHLAYAAEFDFDLIRNRYA